MRLVFLGSPASVIVPLQTLATTAAAHGHQLVGAVSQPARPIGRKGTPADPPVAAWAKAHGIATLQPVRASDPDFLDQLRALSPDVCITAAYGQILNDEFLAIPKRGTINIHPSLLPKYRGATPVPAALLDGETTSGVTILFTVKKLDAGAIIMQQASPIAANETAGTLTDRYFQIGAGMLVPALSKLSDVDFKGSPQDEAQATYCRKIQKSDGLIDWTLPAEEIYNRFRAFQPWPGTFSFCQGKRISFTAMQSDPSIRSALAPGEATFDKRQQTVEVGTGEGLIKIARLQPAGGKELQAAAFWNGLKDRSRVAFVSSEV